MRYKSMILILALFILFSIAGVSAGEVDEKVMMSDENLEMESTPIEKDLKTVDDSQVLSKTNDDKIQSVKDNDLIGADIDSDTNSTFSELTNEIGAGGNITLTYKLYNYDQGNEPIKISVANSVIDGNGAVIDMTGSDTQVLQIWDANNVTIKNLTIKNAHKDQPNYFIYVDGSDAKILDCNFIDNNGHEKGVIFFQDTATNGAVTNCTFINNKAGNDSYGGAIYFMTYGTVTNCYFSDNHASKGDDIYSEDSSVTADTCIFKGTGTTENVKIVPPTLNVDNFTTVNNSGEKLTFDLKTNSSMPIDNGNISISVYNKNDGSLVTEDSCLSGEGWAVDLPAGSYYAIFNTEYAGFKAINRTITVIPDIEYYINITLESTNNLTAHIAAKSNIPEDIIGNELTLILPNGTEFLAAYDSNGTWRASHTFEDYGAYEISAVFTKLKNVTINNATITIKGNSTVDLEDIILDYGETRNVTVTTRKAKGITAIINDKPVEVVDNYTISISGLDAGNYTLTVTTIPEDYYNSVNKTVSITVNKLLTEIAAKDLELTFADKSNLTYELIPEGIEGNISFISSNPEVANVTSDGEVTAVSVGTANVTIIFSGNENYEKSNKTVKVKVNKANSTAIIESQELDYGTSLNITANTTGATGITAKIGDEDVKVDGFAIEIPVLDVASYTLTVTTIPDENHNAVTANATITVKKIDSTLSVSDIEFTYKSNGTATATFTGATGVIAEVVNQSQATVNVNGTNITVSNLDVGTYSLKVTTIADDNHNAVTKTAKITVNKIQTKITLKGTVKVFNDNRILVITLKDTNGNAISGADLVVQLKGTKTYKTDKNGQVKIITKGFVPNTYVTKITFKGNSKYDKSARNVNVIVKKATPKLTAKMKTFKRAVKVKKYSVSLKNNQNKPMKGLKITLKVNNKVYSAKTNNKGVAIFKITNLAKKAKFIAAIKFAGTKYYNAKTVKQIISIK